MRSWVGIGTIVSWEQRCNIYLQEERLCGLKHISDGSSGDHVRRDAEGPALPPPENTEPHSSIHLQSEDRALRANGFLWHFLNVSQLQGILYEF